MKFLVNMNTPTVCYCVTKNLKLMESGTPGKDFFLVNLYFQIIYSNLTLFTFRIDYERFHDLVNDYYVSEGSKTFT